VATARSLARAITSGEPFHEPQGRAGVSPAPVGNADGTEPLALARSLGRRDACPTLGPLRFLVPMRARKPKQALPEPAVAPRGFGLRQPSGAFTSGPRAQKRQRTAALQDASAPAAALHWARAGSCSGCVV